MHGLAFAIASQPPADANPLIHSTFLYWTSLRTVAGLPSRRQIDPLALPRNLLPYLWLIEVVRAPFRLRYRLSGTAVDLGFAGTVTGRWLDEVLPPIVDRVPMLLPYEQAVAERAPRWCRGPLPTVADDRIVRFETVILPLADDGGDVDRLFGAMILYDRDGRTPQPRL